MTADARPAVAPTGPRCLICGEPGRACGGPTDDTVTPVDMPTPIERSSAMARGQMVYEERTTENGTKYRAKVRESGSEPRDKARRAPQPITSSSAQTSTTSRRARKTAPKKTAAKSRTKKTTASE